MEKRSSGVESAYEPITSFSPFAVESVKFRSILSASIQPSGSGCNY